MNGRNARMLQPSGDLGFVAKRFEHLGFALRLPLRIGFASPLRQERLHGHFALENDIDRAINDAHADLPLGDKYTYTQPTIQFPGVEEHRDYVFCVRYQTFFGGPTGVSSYTQVNDSEPFVLQASRRIIDMRM